MGEWRKPQKGKIYLQKNSLNVKNGVRNSHLRKSSTLSPSSGPYMNNFEYLCFWTQSFCHYKESKCLFSKTSVPMMLLYIIIPNLKWKKVMDYHRLLLEYPDFNLNLTFFSKCFWILLFSVGAVISVGTNVLFWK